MGCITFLLMVALTTLGLSGWYGTLAEPWQTVGNILGVLSLLYLGMVVLVFIATVIVEIQKRN